MREQPDFATHPRPRRPSPREIGLLLVGVLALGLASREAWRARQEAEAARARVTEARRDVASLEARLRGAGGRSAVEATLLSQAAAAVESPPERIVSALARTLPEDARLERLTIEYGASISLEMQVVARAPEAWDVFLSRLEDESSFEYVMPGAERRKGEMRSVVTARWAGASR